MDALSSLIDLGLKEKEARVYLALLRRGECPVGGVVEATGLKPRTAYDCLNSLVREGLAALSEKNGVKQYTASAPNALLASASEKLAKAETAVGELEKIRKSRPEPSIQVFKGAKGVRSVFADKLSVGKTIYWYAGSMQGGRVFVKDYYRIWNAKRVKLGIPIRMILIDKPEVKKFLAGEKLFEGRTIPEAQFSNVVWWLYGSKMAMVFWREEPLVILIEDDELATTYRNFFNLVWKTAGKKLT